MSGKSTGWPEQGSPVLRRLRAGDDLADQRTTFTVRLPIAGPSPDSEFYEA